MGILNDSFKPSLVQKFSTIIVHNALALPIYMEVKFGPLEKGIKNDWHQLRLHFSEEPLGNTLHDHKRNEEILEDMKVESIHSFIYSFILFP